MLYFDIDALSNAMNHLRLQTVIMQDTVVHQEAHTQTLRSNSVQIMSSLLTNHIECLARLNFHASILHGFKSQ
jgi:hypothetical protein